MTSIEETVCEKNLPVNSFAMINRLKELLKENRTNSLSTKAVQEDPRVQKVLWLMMSQLFGQGATIDLDALWFELCELNKE